MHYYMFKDIRASDMPFLSGCFRLCNWYTLIYCMSSPVLTGNALEEERLIQKSQNEKTIKECMGISLKLQSMHESTCSPALQLYLVVDLFISAKSGRHVFMVLSSCRPNATNCTPSGCLPASYLVYNLLGTTRESTHKGAKQHLPGAKLHCQAARRKTTPAPKQAQNYTCLHMIGQHKIYYSHDWSAHNIFFT